MKNEKTISNILSARFNRDITRKFDIKAKEKGLTRSLLLRQIVIDYINKDITNENLLQASVTNLITKVNKQDSKLEFFMQFFYSWLAIWYRNHPQTEGNESIKIQAIENRNKFAQTFSTQIFDEMEDLFDILYADNGEKHINE